MPQPVKKHISKILQDVKHPKKGANLELLLQKTKIPTQLLNITEEPKLNLVKKSWPVINWGFFQNKSVKKIGKITLILIVLATSFYIFNLFSFKKLVLGKAGVIYEETLKGKKALTSFNPKEAEKSFLLANQEMDLVQQKARNFGVFTLANLASAFIPSLRELPSLLSNFGELNQINLAISQEIKYLSEEGPKLAFHNGGPQIISSLENINNNLDKLIALSAQIKNKIALFSNTLNKQFIGTSIDLYKAKDWLSALLSTLKIPGEQHFLLIFQNPSEMRPAGGFIGSHADLTIENGSIKKITVDDIYNADRQLHLKFIPPKQLQSLTKNWGARDANWFFDFPTSAEKVIYFLENSDLYKNRSIKFLGAAAVNVDVIESLLAATGPIEIPQYQLTLTPENFLQEVQYEVEAGRDKKPGQNPKKILSVIAPLIIEKLGNLSDWQKAGIAESIQSHLQNKDVLVYFKNIALESLATELNLGGEILQLPQGFSGDYLAVVNTNIAGGKSDAFINQKIILNSEIGGDGTIHNQLSIERAHSGQNEKEWWYKADNKDFIKILTAPGSNLRNIKNNYYRLLTFPNYDSSYQEDPDLRSMENSELLNKFQTETGEEMGKTYFATWFNVKAGTTNILQLEYDNPIQILIQNGTAYKFVFEKQSGIKGSLEYSVTAPLGYVWKESNSAIYRFQTDNPKAREIIELTLISQ